MKYLIAYSALFAAVLASPMGDGNKGADDDSDMTICENKETVVCNGNGDGGLLSLGNILNGLLGESCSGGEVYCCESGKVDQVGLINLNLNLECSLNRLL